MSHSSLFRARGAAPLATFVALAATLSAACAQSVTVVPEPVALDDLCTELSAALCDVVERCECSAAEIANCRYTYESDCDESLLTPNVRDAVAAGLIVYDPLAAGRVIARLRAPAASCASSADAMGWRLGDVFTFGGALAGTQPTGASCTATSYSEVNVCRDGYCRDGACAPLRGLGGSCDSTTLCVRLDVSADLPSAGGVMLRCAPPDTAARTCQPLLPGGAVCVSRDECTSQACPLGICSPVSAVGAPCTGDNECASGRCGGAGVCVAGNVPLGGACSFDPECANRRCRDGVCEGNLCASFTPRL